MKPPQNPYAPKPVEVSLTTQGRAKAKGTDQSWVDPRHDMYSPLYAQAKSTGDLGWGMPSIQPADDTNAPLTQLLRQHFQPQPSQMAYVMQLLGLR